MIRCVKKLELTLGACFLGTENMGYYWSLMVKKSRGPGYRCLVQQLSHNLRYPSHVSQVNAMIVIVCIKTSTSPGFDCHHGAHNLENRAFIPGRENRFSSGDLFVYFATIFSKRRTLRKAKKPWALNDLFLAAHPVGDEVLNGMGAHSLRDL